MKGKRQALEEKVFNNDSDSLLNFFEYKPRQLSKFLKYYSQLRNQTFFIEGDLCLIEHWLVEFVRLGLFRELNPESPVINYWFDDLHANFDLHA